MRRWVLAVALTTAGLQAGTALAADESLEERVRRLEQRLEEQERLIREQHRVLDEQRRELADRREAAEPAPTPEPSPDTFRVFWKDGIKMETTDKAFQAYVGGRIHADFAAFTEDGDMKAAFGDFENGADFRRARFVIGGRIYERVEFKAEYDFAGGDADFRDVYLGLVELPWVGNLRVGHFKEPFSLEELTSSNFITFMERGLPNAFAPSRNMGFMAQNAVLGERMTWAAGAFRDSDDFGSSSDDGGFTFTGRLTGLPYYHDTGRSLLHLGVAYSHGDPADDEVQFRARPEAALAPRIVDSGVIGSDGVDRVGLEAALVQGPFSLQGEWIYAGVDTGERDPAFDGWYVMASWFLTGEHRAYRPSTAAFDRVRPARSFLFGDGGPGAWEVAARYSNIDLDRGAVRGGELSDVTGGVNWYLNPNTRVMLNYVFADRRRIGDAHAFQTRFQLDF